MTIYHVEYGYEDYHFSSLKTLLKALKSWWRADGTPYWYDEDGRRTHFPTIAEVEYEILLYSDGFYRALGQSGYVVINKIAVSDE